MLERIIAKIGIVGVLAILLVLSILVNLWQFNRAGKAESACNERIAKLVDDVNRKTAAREVAAIDIAREAKEDAEEAVNEVQKETVRYVERIREVRIPVPAECDGPMPDSVRDGLTDAARATSRRL